MRGIIKDKTYYKKEHEKDKLRLFGGAWTINLDELETTDAIFDKIVYQTSKATYTISVDRAWDVGVVKFFQEERKLIVPLKYWSVK